MTHDAIINVRGVRFRDYCEGLIANTFDTNSIKVSLIYQCIRTSHCFLVI